MSTHVFRNTLTAGGESSGRLQQWSGRVLSGLAGTLMLTSGLNLLFVHSAEMTEGFAKFGFSPSVIAPIGLAALLGSLLYLIPRTAMLGAIILTGYLGGAVATHVRVDDPVFIVPAAVGMVLWLGLFLRQSGVRAMLPLAG